MVIINKRIYSKKILGIVISIESLLLLVGFAILIFIPIGQKNNNNENLMFVSTFCWVGCGWSFLDIAFYIFRKEFISFKIIFKIRTKFGKTKEATNGQILFLDAFFTNQSNSLENKTVLISGQKGTGKSECANFILKKMYSKINDIHGLLKYKFYYIDFFNDSLNATKDFNGLQNSDLNQSIIILDNSNEADISIIPKIKALNNSNNCCIILIEENNNFFQKIFFSKEDLDFYRLTFEELIPTKESILKNLARKRKTFNVLQKKILFTCKYFYDYYNIFSWNNIKNALKLSSAQSLEGRKYVKRLIRKGIIEYFPLNTKYMRFSSVCESNYIDEFKLYDEKLYNEILFNLYNNEKKDEVKWMSMIDLSFENIVKIDRNDRIQLFNKAISFGNYNKLLKNLLQHANNDDKKNIFSYEFGMLYYYNGKFSSAFEYFKKVNYISKSDLSLKLIETMHGKKNLEIKESVNDSLNFLKNQGNLNAIYAKYWEIHINSEKGVFDLNELDFIRLKLSKINNGSVTLESFLERCITDELRFLWILGEDNENLFNEIKATYDKVFKNKNSFTYYESLYFRAGNLHYKEIPLRIWIKNDLDNLEKKLYNAKKYYDDAINSSFEKNKSKMAAKAKRYDLMLMYNNYEQMYLDDLIAFKNNAIKEEIDLFIAFSDCLLAKGEILKLMEYDELIPLEKDINAIKDKLANSTKIYREYGNYYGVKRNKFINILFDMLLNFNSTHQNEFNDLFEELKCFKNECDSLEKEYISKLMRYRDLRYIDVINTLRYYPIILQ